MLVSKEILLLLTNPHLARRRTRRAFFDYFSAGGDLV